MKVSDIIVILLFIIPGTIAEKISYLIDMPTVGRRSEFKELLNGILWSLPIIIIVSPLMCLIFWIGHVKEFSEKFDDIMFLIIFSALSLVFAAIIGFLKGCFSKKITDFINMIRGKKNKIEIDNKSCWQKLFLDDPDCHYVEIIKGEDSYKGFTKWYSLPDEEKELVIYIPDYLQEEDKYQGYEEQFTTVNQTYVNIEKNIVIKDYDMENYYTWLQEKINQNNQS